MFLGRSDVCFNVYLFISSKQSYDFIKQLRDEQTLDGVECIALGNCYLNSYGFAMNVSDLARASASLVASNDFDDFPRFPPQMSGFGQSAVRPFFNGQFLGGYWNELVRYHSAPYCIASLHRVREQQIAPDLMIVDCEVRFIMNTQLWLLLIFVALLIALSAPL